MRTVVQGRWAEALLCKVEALLQISSSERPGQFNEDTVSGPEINLVIASDRNGLIGITKYRVVRGQGHLSPKKPSYLYVSRSYKTVVAEGKTSLHGGVQTHVHTTSYREFLVEVDDSGHITLGISLMTGNVSLDSLSICMDIARALDTAGSTKSISAIGPWELPKSKRGISHVTLPRAFLLDFAKSIRECDTCAG